MEIRILLRNVAVEDAEIREYVVDLPEDATIQDLLGTIGYGAADLSEYYPMSGVFSWNESYVPYLFVNGKVQYDVLFEEARIKDFIYTHGISDGTIQVVTGYPWAGGPGFLELAEIWEQVWPVLEVVAVVCSVTGFSLKNLYNYLRNKFRKQPPHTFVDIIFSRERWSASELAELLDMEPDKTKNLLTLFDYRYDPKQQQYMKGEHAEECRRKLMDITVHDF